MFFVTFVREKLRHFTNGTMQITQATPEDIAALVAFLPLLYADGFEPIKKWSGGQRNADGSINTTWPEYDETVLAFYRTASSACWCDYAYDPAQARQMLNDHTLVANASLAQIKTMLTYCQRGERFNDGHWASMITQGHIRRLLAQLIELTSQP